LDLLYFGLIEASFVNNTFGLDFVDELAIGKTTKLADKLADANYFGYQAGYPCSKDFILIYISSSAL
jgi:hypothetical protein